jgi:hypothetical protein
MKRKTIEHLAALVIAIAVIILLDKFTNRLDDLKGHVWDFVYYIDMAEHGVWGNPNLGAPYAYRFLTPLIARFLNFTFHQRTYFGFKVTAYLGLTGELFGLYWLARKLKDNFFQALIVMMTTALALFNVKFLVFDFYRPDQLAYPLLVFSILALLADRWWLALILSTVGLISREYLIIPPLIILYTCLRDWLRDRRDWRPVAKAATVAVSVGLVFALPRALIPVSFTQQILDPFHDPNYMKTLIGMPFNWSRDFNFLFDILAYFMPLLILATPQRLKHAWEGIRPVRAWFFIYVAVNLVGMMYGGTDMMRYVTFFFIPQTLLLIYVLREDVHILEIVYLAIAMVIFNRLLDKFPIWDFNAYLDFYGGYGDHIDVQSILRLVQVIGFIFGGQALRWLLQRVHWPGQTGWSAGWFVNADSIRYNHSLPENQKSFGESQ